MISQDLLNAQAALMAARQRNGVVYTPYTPLAAPTAYTKAQWAASMQIVPPAQAPVIEEQGSRVMVRETINHHADIGIAAMRATQSGHYQLWLLLRLMDEKGRGWVDLEWAFLHLASAGSKWRRYKGPRLHQLLAEGNGRYWTTDSQRIWLRKTVQVAGALGIDRLNGRFVQAAVTDIQDAIAPFRAYLFSTWLGNHRNPMSRATIERLTGLSARTQQRYGELAGIETVENIALGPYLTAGSQQDAHWHHDGVFTFVDRGGRQGPAHRQYVAWHLPSSYTSTAPTVGRSQTRHANKQLAVLAKETGAPGNDHLFAREHITRRFHTDGKRAALAQRHAEAGNDEMYWQLGRAKTGRGLWQQMGSTP
jgi:hypothetical protein